MEELNVDGRPWKIRVKELPHWNYLCIWRSHIYSMFHFCAQNFYLSWHSCLIIFLALSIVFPASWPRFTLQIGTNGKGFWYRGYFEVSIYCWTGVGGIWHLARFLMCDHICIELMFASYLKFLLRCHWLCPRGNRYWLWSFLVDLCQTILSVNFHWRILNAQYPPRQ